MPGAEDVSQSVYTERDVTHETTRDFAERFGRIINDAIDHVCSPAKGVYPVFKNQGESPNDPFPIDWESGLVTCFANISGDIPVIVIRSQKPDIGLLFETAIYVYQGSVYMQQRFLRGSGEDIAQFREVSIPQLHYLRIEQDVFNEMYGLLESGIQP